MVPEVVVTSPTAKKDTGSAETDLSDLRDAPSVVFTDVMMSEAGPVRLNDLRDPLPPALRGARRDNHLGAPLCRSI